MLSGIVVKDELELAAEVREKESEICLLKGEISVLKILALGCPAHPSYRGVVYTPRLKGVPGTYYAIPCRRCVEVYEARKRLKKERVL